MIRIAQFTSQSTAADATIMLGAVPDAVILISNAAATNPDLYFWVNGAKYSKWPGSDNDDGLKLTGSTGVITQQASVITAHDGNTEVVASTDEDTYKADGSNASVGDRTQAGIVVDSTAQANSGENIVIALYGSLPSVPA